MHILHDTQKIRTPLRLDSFGFPTREKNDSSFKFESTKRFEGKNSISESDFPNAQDKKLKETSNDFIAEKKALKKDTTNKQETFKKLKKAISGGIISVGYDYGFLPYTVNMPSPSSAIKTEGLVETDVFNIPLDITYFYTTQKNLIGVNNYFRISYNAERYNDKLKNKLSENLDSYKSKLGDLNSQKQSLMQKMAYTDYLSSISPDKWPLDTSLTKNKPNLPNAKLDTTGLGGGSIKFDPRSNDQYFNANDSLKQNAYYSKADSIEQKAIYNKNKSDSVVKLYEDYKGKYNLLSDSIKRVQYKITELESLANAAPSSYGKLPYFTNGQNFLSGVKKMVVGLCYPAYSTFLANNIPVRGINFEYQKNKRFFAFTYGTTVSTLLYNNKNIEGILQNVRNSYNYFDVNTLSAGRKILSAKFGFGEKEGDHVFAGFLLGKGATTYYADLENPTSRLVESNLVIEADVRKKILKNTVLGINIGKSSIQDGDLNLNIIRVAAKEVFSSYRSYAMLVKLKTSIPTTKSNLTFSVRWVDPFFNSYGIGFMRSDNLRYEVKLDQPFGKSFRYTIMFRHEEDNLLKLLNYKNTFYSINNTVSYKIKRGLMLRVGYTPLIRTLNGENYHFTNKNVILTGILTFTPKSKNIQKQFNLLYNNYHVNTDSTPINFQNFTYYHQFVFKGGGKTGLNLSWFKNNLKDTIGNDMFLAVLDVGYQFKNGSLLSVAAKSAYRINGQLYPGFIIKSVARLSKTLFWENQIEKFIVGDLFNGYDLENLKRFPYCFTTKLILNF